MTPTLIHSLDIPAETIETAPTDWCKRWWKTCCKKIPQGTRVAALRAQIREWQRTLRDTGRLQIQTGIAIPIPIPHPHPHLYFTPTFPSPLPPLTLCLDPNP